MLIPFFILSNKDELSLYPRCLFISDDLVNVLTVCNNERVAVTIEVKILAFPKREEGGSEHAKIFFVDLILRS